MPQQQLINQPKHVVENAKLQAARRLDIQGEPGHFATLHHHHLTDKVEHAHGSKGNTTVTANGNG